MKTTAITPLFAAIAATVAAAPGGSRLADRIARRAAGLTHDPSPLELITPPGNIQAISNDTKQISYSSNWAGAVLLNPPAGTTFQQAHGYFNVPQPSPPPGAAPGTYAASAWVGIDGDTYGNAILQSGCDFLADTNGGTSYDCWYEWFPNALVDFDNFGVQAGDVIAVAVVADANNYGTATITNTRTGQVASQIVNAPNDQAVLGGQNAEWIVEDFSSNGGLVPFANFGQVHFTGTNAQGANGQVVGNDGADTIVITQNGRQLTDVQIPSGSEVVVTYTG